ncbi:hypothetical protein B0I35DRAFT_516863 [Stachybotrys elegans]|uniref:PA14 domain-containing protein n=1 Tax=Stachybotrys elegans TaxID=80388 RepID=A0A8K0WKN4_9HYPO|nr:hypothetical protein B0I35DRAFT_516863 [Stachybotrys elegans]
MRTSAGLAAVLGAAAAVASELNARGCGGDNCGRAVMANRFGAATMAARLADCSSYLSVTVTPSTSTRYVTETVSTTVTYDPLAPARRDEGAAAAIAPRQASKVIPAYASPCSGVASKYISACSCYGATAATTTAPTPIFTSTVVVTDASTVTLRNSPPLDTKNVVIPDFDDWTATYTFEEFTLPVFEATAPVEIPTPVPTTECFVDPAADGNEFYLLEPGKSILGNRDGIVGQPKNPETQEEADEMFEAMDNGTFEFPLYSFEKPADAPEGRYDLVLINGESKLYIALEDDGEMVFVSGSTGPTKTDGHITTIFGVTCKGRLTVHVGDNEYLWKGSGNSTIAQLGEVDNTAIAILPKDAESQPEKRGYDGMGQSGGAPRCPATPWNVWPRVRAGARGYNPNGCGPANGIDLVPDFSWSGCCNEHDNCFDNCDDKTFEGCNSEFHGCMHNRCRADYNRWWNAWLRPACLKTADFYAYMVGTDIGKKAFYASNSERCECACKNGQDLCKTGGSFNCISTENNNDHCGGCDRQCPYKTHCSGKGCVCDVHQCGSKCLDMRTNPFNCGRCGNVCESGFCYNGVCYDPPENPDRCYPRQGFENGDVKAAKGALGWSAEGATGDARAYFSVFDGAAGDSYGSAADLPSGGFSAISLVQDVRVCAGTAYDFDFQTRRVRGDGTCRYALSIGSRFITGWNNLPPTLATWNNVGPIRVNPFWLNQEGARQGSRHYLIAKFALHLQCDAGRSQWSGVRFDSFSLIPA